MWQKTKLVCALIAVFAFIAFFHSHCLAWQGQVVGVLDGDLFAVSHDNVIENIRLYGIAAPKRGQPFWEQSGALARHLANQKIVEVTPLFKGSDGIDNGLVRIDGSKDYLNVELISHGFAWVKPTECSAHICAEWRGLENLARSNAIGLWADPAPVPPWEWQKEQRMKIREDSQKQEKPAK
jgi:endonuclease YncB( thermonuclease family)